MIRPVMAGYMDKTTAHPKDNSPRGDAVWAHHKPAVFKDTSRQRSITDVLPFIVMGDLVMFRHGVSKFRVVGVSRNHADGPRYTVVREEANMQGTYRIENVKGTELELYKGD